MSINDPRCKRITRSKPCNWQCFVLLGTGKGGQSIWGRPFADEIRPTLKVSLYHSRRSTTFTYDFLIHSSTEEAMSLAPTLDQTPINHRSVANLFGSMQVLNLKSCFYCDGSSSLPMPSSLPWMASTPSLDGEGPILFRKTFAASQLT